MDIQNNNEISIENRDQWHSQVEKSAVPVIVDFYADWCPPCQKLKPVLENGASNSNGKWILAKVNVDNNKVSDISAKYTEDGIPAVYLWVEGKITSQFLGYDEKAANKMIQQASK